MSKPRFYIGTVRGYALFPEASSTAGKGPPPVTYTVHDRLFCHRTLAEFTPPMHGGAVLASEARRRLADALCARLNAEHEAWLDADPERRRVAV